MNGGGMMLYLKTFYLLNESGEDQIICTQRNIHNSYYPLHIFPEKEFRKIEFEPITIFYGGNGSGKTTLLHIIANKLNASKKNINDLGDLFERYVEGCDYQLENGRMKEIKLILSDDVFDYLLDMRAINSNVNRRKELLSEEYHHYKKKAAIEYSSLGQYEDLKNKVDVNRWTESKYIRSRLGNNNIIQESNGESALRFWQNEIQDHAIYIIDEPENSLSAENQLRLKQFIEDSARFYDCQFIIATHSPFLLSLDYAKVYDLDSCSVKTKKWTELENVRTYFEFFQSKENEFMK